MRRVACRPRRNPLCAAKRGGPGAREKLAEAVCRAPPPSNGCVARRRPCSARSPRSRRWSACSGCPASCRGPIGPRSLQQPVHTGEVELVARHGRDGGEHGPERIGERLGLSGDRVRQIERRTRRKLAAGARHSSRTSP